METKKKGYKEVFTTPEGYFERLAKDISAATVENSTVAPKRRIVIGKWYRIAGYAAALAIMFATGIGLSINKSADKHATQQIAATAEEQTVEGDYIDNILNSYTIDDYTFYCYLTNSDFE